MPNEAFPYFLQLFSKSGRPVRNWLGWDEAKLEFKNKKILDEFIGWLYPKTDGGSNGHGDFDRRILPRSIDVRDVAKLVRDDPKTFRQFRRERDIDKARSITRKRRNGPKAKGPSDPLAELLEAVTLCNKLLKDDPFRLAADEKSEARLQKLLDALRKRITEIIEDRERRVAGHESPPIVRY